MIILAIDTSCDDTSVAVVEKTKAGKLKIKSDIVSSQEKMHKKYGGVYPTLAKREHQRNLLPVLIKALKQSKLLETTNGKLQITDKRRILNNKSEKIKQILEREPGLARELVKFLKKYQKPRLCPSGYGGQAKIEAIAITIGPGLEPCLWTGINFARALSFFWNLPLIPVNHLEAHLLANFLLKTNESDIGYIEKVKLPAIGLVASGGNTLLVLIRDIGQYRVIGQTRDDAAGECFDKTARILGLAYPGGPAIAAEAAKLQMANTKLQIKLPRPMLKSKNYDFSFSGLKTAVLYDFKKRSKRTGRSREYVGAMAQEIQQSIIDVLIEKTIKATKGFKAKTILLGGGVICNKELRRQFKKAPALLKTEMLMPACGLCTDNAAMIAAAAFFHKQEKIPWQKARAEANLRI